MLVYQRVSINRFIVDLPIEVQIVHCHVWLPEGTQFKYVGDTKKKWWLSFAHLAVLMIPNLWKVQYGFC